MLMCLFLVVLGSALVAYANMRRARRASGQQAVTRKPPRWGWLDSALTTVGIFIAVFGGAQAQLHYIGWWAFLLVFVLLAAASWLPPLVVKRKRRRQAAVIDDSRDNWKL